MINSVQSLKDKAKNYALEHNVAVQYVLQNYMFERFLERVSISKYVDRFIIKGGILLSSIMGLNMRTTMDIDADVTAVNFEKEALKEMIDEIISIDLKDDVKIELVRIEDIREEIFYGGFKFKLFAKFGNLQVPFSIDISTGDVITPKAIKYKYTKTLEDGYIELYCFNNETIIAEKLQTILTRGINNSRLKDYYDLYYFITNKWDEIDKEILKQAIKNTFKKRNSENELQNSNLILEILEDDITLNKYWNIYKEKHSYAQNIEFKSIIEKIKQILNI